MVEKKKEDVFIFNTHVTHLIFYKETFFSKITGYGSIVENCRECMSIVENCRECMWGRLSLAW